MPPLPSRKSLESLKRVDLQRMCKDYGVKANLKSEELIDLLLDTQSAPAPQPTRRSVSTKHSSGKAGPSRVSSMIVHDISEDEQEQDEEPKEPPEESREETPALPVEQPPPRTRKAKELQTRLGVGKPLAAGGQGPRTVTRSSVGSRGKRAKSSRSIKPKEATIEEEPETASAASKVPGQAETTQQLPEITPSPHHPPKSPSLAPDASETLSVKKMIDDAIRPLQGQIRILKAELSEMQNIKTELENLKSQVIDLSEAQRAANGEFAGHREMPASIASLKEDVNQLRELLSTSQSPPQPSTPKGRSSQPTQPPTGFGMPSALNVIYPGVPDTILGKRQRTATPSHIVDAEDDADQEDGRIGGWTNKKDIRSSQEKARIQKDRGNRNGNIRRSTSRQHSSDLQDVGDHRASETNDDIHVFTVFRGSDEPSDYIDPPPPTNRLPDFFEPDSPPISTSNLPQPKSTTGMPTSSAHAAENQPHAFGFGFLPISSTPQNPMYMPSFPYPDPPQSPSPAGPSLGSFMGRQDERTDIFKSFGLPSPIKSSRHYGALTQEDRGVNPAAITQGSSGKQREPSANLGPTASSSDTVDPPLSKATMYGTELDGDTRFGDFGLEGIATGYWANNRKY